VAIANKNAPIAWALLAKGDLFKDGIAVRTAIEPTRKAACSFLRTY
jgi:hypothetical protein